MRKAPESSRKAVVSLYVSLAVLLGKSIQSRRKLWKKNHNQIVAVNGRRRRGPQDPALPRSFCRCPGGRPGGEHERAHAVLPVQGPAERAPCPLHVSALGQPLPPPPLLGEPGVVTVVALAREALRTGRGSFCDGSE